ncbi:hypothetical protein, partial [Enterococcus faecalis]|uniref:hypothetical protein n=1 Tax=Enterococcus faecalis TaxID=1351 RepID=UPI003CC6C1FB
MILLLVLRLFLERLMLLPHWLLLLLALALLPLFVVRLVLAQPLVILLFYQLHVCVVVLLLKVFTHIFY